MKNLLPLFTLCLFLFKNTNAQVSLQQFASGFTRPCDIANCGDDRLFIVEQRGYIWILDKDGNKLPNPFLNIDPIVGSSGNEQGLLGLAFHPDYPNTPYFFVNYTDNSGDTHISRFSLSTSDPNLADPDSELNLFTVDQPYSNHNGGCLKFGPDGYLYIGLGDGGSGGDPQGNGQKKTTFLAKMLRLDVDNGTPYAIPPTNPFVNDATTLDEIWAIGVRNPWRFSFDRLTGDLWVGDVGQDSWEEVDFQPASSPGGENYGWKIMEGNHCFSPSSGCNMAGLTLPVAEYANAGATGCSMTGGFVYRGFNYPELFGRYLYTDYCTGLLWSLVPDGNGGWTKTQIADLLNNQLVSFGENKNGELFALGNSNGNVYRVTEGTAFWGYSVSSQNILCPSDMDGAIQIDFMPNTPTPTVTWSDGPTGPTRTGLGAGTYTATIVGENGSIATEEFVIASSVSISTTVSDVVCPGGQDGAIGIVVQGSTGPATATWSDGGTGLERIELFAGPYSVTVTTAEGCVISEDYVVVTLLPSPNPVIVAVGDTLTILDGQFENYNQWLLNGEPIAGANDTVYVATESGTYSLAITDDIGCTGISNAIFIDFTAANVIPELKSVTVTPNPFTQNVHLEVTVSEPLFIQLYISDLNGKNLLTDRLAVTSTATRNYNLGKIPSGTYLLVLKNGKGEWVERLLKL